MKNKKKILSRERERTGRDAWSNWLTVRIDRILQPWLRVQNYCRDLEEREDRPGCFVRSAGPDRWPVWSLGAAVKKGFTFTVTRYVH